MTGTYHFIQCHVSHHHQMVAGNTMLLLLLLLFLLLLLLVLLLMIVYLQPRLLAGVTAAEFCCWCISVSPCVADVSWGWKSLEQQHRNVKCIAADAATDATDAAARACRLCYSCSFAVLLETSCHFRSLLAASLL